VNARRESHQSRRAISDWRLNLLSLFAPLIFEAVIWVGYGGMIFLGQAAAANWLLASSHGALVLSPLAAVYIWLDCKDGKVRTAIGYYLFGWLVIVAPVALSYFDTYCGNPAQPRM